LIFHTNEEHMKILKQFECQTDQIQVGWMDGDDWEPLEEDDAPRDQEIAKLLKQKNANELILRCVLDFALQLREALNADMKELYERSAKE